VLSTFKYPWKRKTVVDHIVLQIFWKIVQGLFFFQVPDDLVGMYPRFFFFQVPDDLVGMNFDRL